MGFPIKSFLFSISLIIRSGYYILREHDHIAYRYEVLSIIGKGSFGNVVKVLDHKTGNKRAIKIIRSNK